MDVCAGVCTDPRQVEYLGDGREGLAVAVRGL